MIAGVADTHAALWYLFDDPRLSFPAKTFIDQAAKSGRKVIISVISLVETGIVDAMRQVPRADIPDMPDRIVAATAVYFGVPVISRDGKIRSSSVQTIW